MESHNLLTCFDSKKPSFDHAGCVKTLPSCQVYERTYPADHARGLSNRSPDTRLHVVKPSHWVQTSLWKKYCCFNFPKKTQYFSHPKSWIQFSSMEQFSLSVCEPDMFAVYLGQAADHQGINGLTRYYKTVRIHCTSIEHQPNLANFKSLWFFRTSTLDCPSLTLTVTTIQTTKKSTSTMDPKCHWEVGLAHFVSLPTHKEVGFFTAWTHEKLGLYMLWPEKANESLGLYTEKSWAIQYRDSDYAPSYRTKGGPPNKWVYACRLPPEWFCWIKFLHD